MASVSRYGTNTAAGQRTERYRTSCAITYSVLVMAKPNASVCIARAFVDAMRFWAPLAIVAGRAARPNR